MTSFFGVLLAILALLSGVIATKTMEDHFHSFQEEYGKVYAQDAVQAKFETFKQNLALINEMNIKHDGVTEFAVNQFADMTPQEFRDQVLSSCKSSDHSAVRQSHQAEPKNIASVPDSFDWRDQGFVSPPRNQGSAGTCWAHSVSETIESAWAISHNNTNITPLSVEQLVECDKNNCGMFGGYMYSAMESVIQWGGLNTEKEFPYCSGDGSCYPCMPDNYNVTMCGKHDDLYCKPEETCTQMAAPFSASISSWDWLTTDEEQLRVELMARGPLSVGLDAWALQFYKRGVYEGHLCATDLQDIDHAVVITGFGEDKHHKWWNVRNSWGAKWGESGYFRIVRNKSACGINKMVISPVV
eukprot:TRINITY_DN240_c0_g1_i3.p1 TRINITY_DN240_c0_g1~~TRINITY_DN240_c0_g1_i3.p1  ORF type:complete len:356 (-),score=66.36 TRINITY_DN240_c0_g1_i3:21-1088(-)